MSSLHPVIFSRSHSESAESHVMSNLSQSIRKFIVEEDGPTAVEYAVMLALIVVVCLTSVRVLGIRTRNNFTRVKTALS